MPCPVCVRSVSGLRSVRALSVGSIVAASVGCVPRASRPGAPEVSGRNQVAHQDREQAALDLELAALEPQPGGTPRLGAGCSRPGAGGTRTGTRRHTKTGTRRRTKTRRSAPLSALPSKAPPSALPAPPSALPAPPSALPAPPSAGRLSQRSHWAPTLSALIESASLSPLMDPTGRLA